MTKEQIDNHCNIITLFSDQGVNVYITASNTVHLTNTAEILFQAASHEPEDLQAALNEWCSRGEQIDDKYIVPF